MEKYIIILILIVILYFLFFYTSCNNIEKAGNTTPGNLNSDLVDSINNLGQLAKDIQKPTGLTLPASLIVTNNADISGKLNVNGNADISGKLNVNGNADISGKLNVNGPINFLPKGCVIAWSGELADIPYGWGLCDGSNGRPNLTGRFIVGVGQPTGDISANPNNLLFGTNGGEQQHKLTIPEIPRHQHTVPKTWGLPQGGDGGYSGNDSGVGGSSLCRPSGGGDQYHNNMPPYYVLYWIIKTI